jgi:hypothetical protein
MIIDKEKFPIPLKHRGITGELLAMKIGASATCTVREIKRIRVLASRFKISLVTERLEADRIRFWIRDHNGELKTDGNN